MALSVHVGVKERGCLSIAVCEVCARVRGIIICITEGSQLSMSECKECKDVS